MNQVNPKVLLHSKWTKVEVQKKEKHFAITEVEYDETGKVITCLIQAVINHNEYNINWRDLKNPQLWKTGWQ